MKVSENLPRCHIGMCCGNRLVVASSLYKTLGNPYQHMCEHLYLISPRTFLGLCGIGHHCREVLERVRFRKELYEKNENREMVPEVIAVVISNLLYEHRFSPYNVEVIIASLHPKTSEPYICKIDSIGGINVRNDFVAIGGLNKVDRNNLYSQCQQVWHIHRKTNRIATAISEVAISWERKLIEENIDNMEHGLAQIIREISCGVTFYIIDTDEITKKNIYEKSERERRCSRDPRIRK